MEPRLGIVVSHPIQYYSPLFRSLAGHLNIVVFYCHNPSDDEIGREGFGIKFKWDVDLLNGYEYIFLKNKSSTPSLNTFKGCNTPDIGKKIKENKITHVLIMGWNFVSYWQAYLYCIKNKIPVAVRGDSRINPEESFVKSVTKKLFYPFFIKRYSTLFYVGKKNREYLIRYGAKPRQLIFAPHAVDQDFWKPDHQEKQKSDKIIFLWVAKFIQKKRPFDMIKAFQKAYFINNDIELWLVGTGELLKEANHLAGENQAIKFIGFKNQTELKKIYSQVHCLVLTSDYEETWGLVVNEAFSMGVPAIVSNACGCAPDLIVDNETGCIYEKGNTNELSEKILFVAHKIKTGIEWSQKGISKKNKIYSYKSNLIALKQFIDN